MRSLQRMSMDGLSKYGTLRAARSSLAGLEFLPDAGDGASLIGRIRQLHRQLLPLFGRGIDTDIIPDRRIEKRLRLGIGIGIALEVRNVGDDPRGDDVVDERISAVAIRRILRN